MDDFGNHARWPDFRSALQEVGISPGIWCTEGGNLFMAPDDTDFVIGELEDEADYQGLMLVCDVLSEIPPVPRAIITNFSPLTAPGGIPIKDKAAPLLECGFKCITEAYLGDNPSATPDNLNFYASHYGWKETQPAFGVWNAPLSTYAPWHAWPGCSDYLGEYVP